MIAADWSISLVGGLSAKPASSQPFKLLSAMPAYIIIRPAQSPVGHTLKVSQISSFYNYGRYEYNWIVTTINNLHDGLEIHHAYHNISYTHRNPTLGAVLVFVLFFTIGCNSFNI